MPGMNASHKDSGGTGALRGMAQVIGASLLVTGVIAGGYVAFVGLPDDAPIAAAPAKSEKAAKAEAKAKAKAEAEESAEPDAGPTEKPGTEGGIGRRALIAADALPTGNMRDTAREAVLIGYLKGLDIPITREGAPAAAARLTCGLLDEGRSASGLITEVKDGADLNPKQSQAFLLGASTLYCPSHASKFRSFKD
ncbi:MAG: DUF732 domain-containing protein [Sporichthyaceae bacterium]